MMIDDAGLLCVVVAVVQNGQAGLWLRGLDRHSFG